MTKKTKIALLSVPILFGIYLIFKQFAKSKTDVKDNKVVSSCTFPLTKGMPTCDLVKQMQQAFNSMSSSSFAEKNNQKYLPLVEDGVFGSKTEAIIEDHWGKELWLNDPKITQEDFNNIMLYKGQ